jgi:release factor glutamine methyltransferase
VKVKTWLENFFQTEKELLVNNYPGLTLSIFENHFIDLLKKNHYLPTLDQSIWGIENRKLMQWSKNWISGEPLAYQLGEGYFFSYPIRLNADCLVPRNETELILELAPLKQNMKVLDLCSGPGTIGLGCLLFSRLPLDVHFVDIDEKVIKWAKQNAFNLKNSYHPSSSTSFYVQDVREKLPINEVDLIVANPPYIPYSAKKDVHSQVINYEPEIALFIKDAEYENWFTKFFEQGLNSLKRSGIFILEGHEDQLQKLNLLAQTFEVSEVSLAKDLTGRLRFLKIIKKD